MDGADCRAPESSSLLELLPRALLPCLSLALPLLGNPCLTAECSGPGEALPQHTHRKEHLQRLCASLLLLRKGCAVSSGLQGMVFSVPPKGKDDNKRIIRRRKVRRKT